MKIVRTISVRRAASGRNVDSSVNGFVIMLFNLAVYSVK